MPPKILMDVKNSYRLKKRRRTRKSRAAKIVNFGIAIRKAKIVNLRESLAGI